MSGFLRTPKPRELTEEEIDRFNLKYQGEKEIKPAYEHTGNVWCAADDGKLPTYRFYNCGTNYLIILKYTPSGDIWEAVELKNVDTLYGIVWLMCLKLNKSE